MARSRLDIKRIMTDAFMTDPVLIEKYELTAGQTFEQEFSLVSVENILFDQLSAAIEEHEKLVEKNAENSRSHNISWYKALALNFYDGLSLINQNGSFQYDFLNLVDADERKIIKRVAVLPSLSGELIIKIATAAGVLSNAQLVRFTDYINLTKDAGTNVRIVNLPADELKMVLNVYVDVSVIDLDTGRLLSVAGEVYPVKERVNTYLENLEFNGAFVKTLFQSELERGTGIKIPLLETVLWKYAGFDFEEFGEWKIPEAGYFKIAPENLTINYLKYDLANN